MNRIAAVSYLNARPLTHGLDRVAGVSVCAGVPSSLLGVLERGDADLALCPVIDYHRARAPLQLVPAGGIGSRDATLTVRLFSRVSFERVSRVHVDGDSHTSVALLQVLFDRLWGRRLELETLAPVTDAAAPWSDSEAVLLIGDKVVTRQPRAEHYPHQLDLGQAWRASTGLPFVFAVWMAPAGAKLGDLPQRLAELRRRNEARVPELVARYAGPAGWPSALALEYLGRLLCYEIGPPQLEAIELFWRECHRLGIVADPLPLRLAR